MRDTSARAYPTSARRLASAACIAALWGVLWSACGAVAGVVAFRHAAALGPFFLLRAVRGSVGAYGPLGAVEGMLFAGVLWLSAWIGRAPGRSVIAGARMGALVAAVPTVAYLLLAAPPSGVPGGHAAAWSWALVLVLVGAACGAVTFALAGYGRAPLRELARRR